MSIDALFPARSIDRDLERLYRSWRILDLVGETATLLPPEWLQILNVARTLLAGSPIPGVDVPESLMQMVRDEPDSHVVRRVERKRRIVQPVTGDTTVQPLRHLNDLPLVAPPDLMLRNLSEELFEYRLLSGNVHGVYNVEPRPVIEEWDEIIEERVPVEAPRRRNRQRVYVLFDVSNSMRENNKLIFAKALVLAYLLVACEEGARIYFRTFANRIHSRTDCLDPGSFATLAQRILRIEPDGSTDIRVAFSAALGEIAALDGVGRAHQPFQRSPTELLLISDCESYSVPQIPRGVTLHTVHLTGGYMARGYQEGFELVRKASTSFYEIDTTRLVLPETIRDRWLLQQDGRRRAFDRDGPGSGAASRSERRQGLLTVYERLAETSTGRPGGARRGRPLPGHRAPLGVVLRALWAQLKNALRLGVRRRERVPASPVFGLRFRVRHSAVLPYRKIDSTHRTH